jgi:hypothetical protein
VWFRREMYRELWLENLKERTPLEELITEGRIILKFTVFPLDIIKIYLGVSA